MEEGRERGGRGRGREWDEVRDRFEGRARSEEINRAQTQ